MNPPRSNFMDKLPLYLIAVVSIGIVYYAVTGIKTKQATGTVTITAFSKTATISVSQLNKNAKVVGTGTANVRLKPGAYLVAASANGHISTGEVTITAKKHIAFTVPYGQTVPIPSSDNITFSNLNELTIHGINSTQLSNIRELFFKYKKTAKTVSIDEGSVQRQYRDPDSDAPYVLSFTGLADNQTFKATITYTNIQDVELALSDLTTGNQLFDMSSRQSAPTR